MKFSSLCDSPDSHSCSGVQTGGLSSCFLLSSMRVPAPLVRVLGLQSTHCSGVLAGSVPLCQGQEGWSSVPALQSLKPYKNILKWFTNPLILPQELEVAVMDNWT